MNRNKEILERFLNRKEKKSDTKEKSYYAILRNIPKELHSKNLRRFFSGFVENAKFQCFHYRHRPELQKEENNSEKKTKTNTCCCLISFKNSELREEFIKEYNGKNWQNESDLEIPRKCFVDRLKVGNESTSNDSANISENDLKEMIELRPPNLMPHGNIGTPSEYFLEQIRLCKMPSSMIAKLGIQTKKRRRKFGEVPFKYDEEEYEEDNEEGDHAEPSTSEDIDPTEKFRKDRNVEDNDEGSDNDDDQCEEWERHEALHNDVTEQDRTKPKKYEEEMEVTWEKGGPGLVWHTDKNYWDEREKGTDCDWAWADDWDVDYSVYYEGKSAGDIDAKAGVEMRNDELMRAGKLEQSVFTRKNQKFEKPSRKRRNSDSQTLSNVQDGTGGRILTKMGWTPGSGLGKNRQGRVVPVAVHMEEDGQIGKDRKGFGYHGEKLARFVEKKAETHCISSIFDEKLEGPSKFKLTGEFTTSEVLQRSHEDTNMKYN
ncbi:unnamed protein product [Caenorhabditis angaria]|uniref:G-patch domain-containing protein n=1 Tax=Caenorhabditis angaria TaxID=860376 RepID=A0A9P1N8S2_9PELO|nr:unnamed protein product [Caenorhabditis angaria]